MPAHKVGRGRGGGGNGFRENGRGCSSPTCARSQGKLPEEEQSWPGQVPAAQLPLTGMAFSVLVVLLLAVLYESIKVCKAKLLHQALMSLSIPTSQQLIEEMDQDSSGSDSPPVSKTCLR